MKKENFDLVNKWLQDRYPNLKFELSQQNEVINSTGIQRQAIKPSLSRDYVEINSDDFFNLLFEFLNKDKDTVQVNAEYLRQLEEDATFLDRLHSLGVDNWEGYSEAIKDEDE